MEVGGERGDAVSVRTRLFLVLLPVIIGVTIAALLGISGEFRGLLDDALRHEAELIERLNRKALQERARTAATSTALSLGPMLDPIDVQALNLAVSGARETVGATNVEVISLDGYLLADGGDFTLLKRISRAEPTHRRARGAVEPGSSWRAETLVAWAPITTGETRRAVLWMQFDLADFEALLRDSERRGDERLARLGSTLEDQLVTYVLLAVLVSMLVAAALSALLTRRTVRIAEAARIATRGDLSVRAQVSGSDELSELATVFNELLAEIERSRESLTKRERERRELEIARRIQTSVLPEVPVTVAGYAIDGTMIAADEVGGDYFDAIVDDYGDLWLAIGDVSGHGLRSGLVMMMCQVAIKVSIASLAHSRSPEVVLRTVNSLLVENVRGRMDGDDHMTLVLLRCSADGAITYAGGHEPLLKRSARGVELVPTPGPWMGLLPELPSLPVSSLFLEKGDVLWLYTDGITEAPSPAGELFGEDRLMQLVDDDHADVATVVDAVVSHVDDLRDDVTVLRIERLK